MNTAGIALALWLLGCALSGCAAQPTQGGAAEGRLNASCPVFVYGGIKPGAGMSRITCLAVITQSSPITATPTSTNTVPVSVTVPVSAVPSIP